MKKSFYVKNLPAKLPIVPTVVLFIALDHWHANDIVRGVCYTVFAILWIACIVSMRYQEPIDLFEFDKDEARTEEKAKSRFQERIEKLAKEKGIKLSDKYN